MQSAAAAGLSARAVLGATRSPNERISICVMGLKGRGRSLLETFASLSEVDITYVTLGHHNWRAFDAKGNQLSEQTGEMNNVGHAQNFIDCMHTRKRPVADLETVGCSATTTRFL